MTIEKTPGAQAPGDENALLNANDPSETEEGNEPEGEEEPEDTEGETPEGEEPEEGETEGQKSKRQLKRDREKAKVKERISAAEATAKAERERADRATAALRALTDDLGPLPKRDDFPDDIEYGAALSAYRAEERVLARTKKNTEANATEAQQGALSSKQQLFSERAMAIADRYPDIRDKVFTQANFPVPPALADAFMESERGPEVAYFLATNPAEMQRVFQMSPLSAARELGRIEARLDAAPKPRTLTNAPKPVPKVGGGASRVAKDPERMDPAEYRKWREAGGGGKR